jgi:hypothetical protein
MPNLIEPIKGNEQLDFSGASNVNLRSARYLIASTLGRCGACRESTTLATLVLPAGHEARELEEATPDDAASCDAWSVAAGCAFLFHVEYLPPDPQRHLQALAPSYRLGSLSNAAEPTWANHCERCGALQDDHELFCEPEGAFVPTTAAAAQRIYLLPIDEIIEATAGGYAFQPQFYEFMVKV